MNRLIPILVVGSLAFVLASKSSDINLPEPRPVLSSVFHPGKTPLNPNRGNLQIEASTNPAADLESNSQVNRRILLQIPQSQPYPAKASNGKIYKYQVPLDDEVEIDDQVEEPFSKEHLQQQENDDGNNGKEITKEESTQEKNDYKQSNSKTKPVVNTDFSSIQDLQLEKSKVKRKFAGPLGNQTVIQGAGTGYHHDVAHPQVIYEPGLDIVVGPHHENAGQHAHLAEYGGQHGANYNPHRAHPESYSKPLKPSLVHRDPHDTFDHHDKIRTLDKDHHKDGHGYGDQHGYVKEFKPYVYEPFKVPECAYKNKHYYNLTFCLEDHAYPLESVLWAVHQSGHFAHQLLSDVTYQSADNLVTGLTRAEEEGYTYKHYFGAAHSQHTHLEQYKPPYHGYTYSADYYKLGGFICPSDIYYGRPKRMMNTHGQWKIIVNIDVPKGYFGHGNAVHKRQVGHGHKGHHDVYEKPLTQTIRVEQCIYAGAPCSYIDSHYHSSCIQKHNFVRLVAWTHEEGLHVDSFKMPIACSCHIRQPIHFYHETSHHVKAHGHVVPPVNAYEHVPVHNGKK